MYRVDQNMTFNQTYNFPMPVSLEERAIAFLEEKINAEEDKTKQLELVKLYVDLTKKVLDHRLSYQQESNKYAIENQKIHSSNAKDWNEHLREQSKLQNPSYPTR